MELSSGRQKLLFVVIVAVLALVGYVLVVPSLHSHSTASAKATASSAPAAVPSTVAPVLTQVPAGTTNIYDWLPFTQQDLADAAATAVKFGEDDDTFTYTESAASYIAKMNGLISGDLAVLLQNAYSLPGVAALRTAQKQTATATASIVSLRGFGPSSLTFIVLIEQRLVSSQKTSNSSQQYQVTLTGSGGSWQVSAIELASLGNS